MNRTLVKGEITHVPDSQIIIEVIDYPLIACAVPKLQKQQAGEHRRRPSLTAHIAIKLVKDRIGNHAVAHLPEPHLEAPRPYRQRRHPYLNIVKRTLLRFAISTHKDYFDIAPQKSLQIGRASCRGRA